MQNPAIQPFKFKFGLVSREVIGGPYRQRFAGHIGIKMAVEIHEPCDIDIPTVDFNVPSYANLDNGVRASLFSIARGKKVFVGCLGGVGRTGLLMAALAKSLGIAEPTKYVRANFKSHAVETKQQEKFIADFEPSLKTKLTASIAKAIAIAYG